MLFVFIPTHIKGKTREIGGKEGKEGESSVYNTSKVLFERKVNKSSPSICALSNNIELITLHHYFS